MKSRTSSCKAAAFRKDLSRFWPVWVGYGLFLVLFQVIMSNDDLTYWYAANIGEAIPLMGIANGIYALVVAQMIFGDLFSPRMCSGIHCLPLRREQWFGAHIASGFLFSLIPTALMLPLSETIIHLYSEMVDGWQLPLYWFAAANIQYIFFFGLAVFCVMCAGNQLGAIVVYGILNFGSLLAYLLVDQMYTPLLKGVVTLSAPFFRLCPMANLSALRFVDAERVATGHTYLDSYGIEQREYIGTFEVIPDGWVYTAIIAVVGIVLLVLARQLYKRRPLEVAGDFLAARWLEPVFQVVFTVLCGSGFHGVFLLFFGLNTDFIYLIFGIGMIVGWFAGRMLLERSTRVFRLKTVGGFLLTAGAVALSLFVTHLDPLGIQVWVPQQEDVKYVNVSIRYQSSYTTEDAAEIADLLRLHEIALEQDAIVHEDYDAYFYNPNVTDHPAKISLTYYLDNGLRAEREYYVFAEGEGGEILREYFSRLDVVISDPDIQDLDDLRHAFRKADIVQVQGYEIPDTQLTEEFLVSLADAIAADCETGTMVQLGAFHPGIIMETSNGDSPDRMLYVDVYGSNLNCYLMIYADCENTLRVLESTGILETVRQAYEKGRG